MIVKIPEGTTGHMFCPNDGCLNLVIDFDEIGLVIEVDNNTRKVLVLSLGELCEFYQEDVITL